MKKLLLIRHAKATQDSGYEDFERPLKYSGLEDAAIIAGRVKTHKHIPQILVTSPSLRTISTANVFSQHLGTPAPEEIKGIYEATEGELVDIVKQLPDNYDFIGLVGHNPGISQALYRLTHQFRDLATCAVALIEFDTDKWDAITTNSGKLVYYSSPDKSL